jgi:hypothetical protein
MRVGVGEEVLRRIKLNQLSRLEKDDPIVVHDGTKSMSDGNELERIGHAEKRRSIARSNVSSLARERCVQCSPRVQYGSPFGSWNRSLNRPRCLRK